MKKIFFIPSLLLLLAVLTMAVNAATDKPHVYVNPGHGGHTSNDRNVAIPPYAQGDTSGFWESNSNLKKGFALRNLLWSQGYIVHISRETNTEDDDLALSTIVSLCNSCGADVFFSIHSNATGAGDGYRVNFPMGFYRGYTNQPENQLSSDLLDKLAPHIISNRATVWSSDSYAKYGDWTFNPSWGTQGYGVLRGNKAAAVLDEGSFHDYLAEAYRLLSKDYCWLEGWEFFLAAEDYFGREGGVDYGIVCGTVRDDRMLREGILVLIGDDARQVIDNATCKLINEAGEVVQTTYTDNDHNGVYLFKNVAPGKYKIEVSEAEHFTKTQEVEVKAKQSTFSNFDLKRVRTTPPAVVSYSPEWKEGDAAVKCNTPIVLQFNWDMDTKSVEDAFEITPHVDGKFTWEDTNYRMIFEPTDAYAINTDYTLTLKKSAMHGGGTPMENDFVMKFRTQDRNHIYPLATFPYEGAEVNTKAGALVEFRTDSLLNAFNLSTYFHVYDNDGNELEFTKRSIKNNKAGDDYGYCRLPLLKALNPGDDYKFVVDMALADTIGLHLEKQLTYNFKAVDAGAEKDGKVVEEFEDVANFEAVGYEAENTSTGKLTAASDNLFGSKSLQLAYTFSNDLENGSVEVKAKAPAEVTFATGDEVGIHVNGDMSQNKLYLMFENQAGGIELQEVGSLDFHGWRYMTTKLSTLTENGCKFAGIVVKKNATKQGRTGTVKFDNLLKITTSGIDDVNANSTVDVNAVASDYIVASADSWIEGVELYNTNGQLVARNASNFVNVSDMADGVYVVKVYVSGAATSKKVVVKH